MIGFDIYRKVYILLISMVLSLVPFMCFGAYHEPTQRWLRRNFDLMVCGILMALVLFIIMMCSTNLRRKKPVDYILLTLMFISIMLFCMNGVALAPVITVELFH